jgi:ABC-2 type transport system ATP-binding protein
MDEAEYCHRAALINQGRLIAIGSPEELKSSALGGALLLIECDALGAALAALQDAPGVKDCSVFGNALHALVADAEQSLRELPGFLAARGIRAGRMSPVQASLEDVFVQLIMADRANQRAAA